MRNFVWTSLILIAMGFLTQHCAYGIASQADSLPLNETDSGLPDESVDSGRIPVPPGIDESSDAPYQDWCGQMYQIPCPSQPKQNAPLESK